ncbi:MAG: DUF1566 domain-containing protein [Actinomycetota bacterium]
MQRVRTAAVVVVVIALGASLSTAVADDVAHVEQITAAATGARPAVRMAMSEDAPHSPGGGSADSDGPMGDGSSGDGSDDGAAADGGPGNDSGDNDGSADDDGAAGGSDPDARPRVVAATGQTDCYDHAGAAIPCAGTGQDGDVQAGVRSPDPRFTDRGDGTVRDNLTGLIWLQRGKCLSDDGKVSWGEALQRAAELADGHDDCRLSDGSQAGDWRVPNVRELMSLVEVGKSSSGPALAEGHPFTNVQIEMHWTSTSRADSEHKAWTGSFFQSGRFDTGTKATARWWVWAVRSDEYTDDSPLSLAATNQTECFNDDGNTIDCSGSGQDGETQIGVPAPAQRFTDNGDGTVLDNLTGLVWMQKADCIAANPFADVLFAVAAIADGECTLSDGSNPGDWRVPNYFEMLSLHDLSEYAPQLTDGHPFTNLRNELYWTSTTLARGSDSNWKMNSVWRNIHGGSKSAPHRAWPVRDAA